MPSTLISSKNNPIYKQLRQLAISRKHRHKTGEFLIESQKGIDALFHHQFECKALFVKEGVPKQFVNSSFSIYTLTDALFNAITSTPNSLVVGQFLMPQRITSCNPAWKKIFFLDALQDPGNLGAILRVAAAFSIDAVVLSKHCVDVFHPKVWRGSMGFSATLPIIEEDDLSLEVIKASGFSCAGLEASAKQSISALSDSKLVLVLGNEGQGISERIKRECEAFYAIPIDENVESLNVAVSAGIVAYQLQYL